ncbi:MAG: hypothetical protein ACRDQ5_11920 [Sciscionella sp.]
MAGIAFLLRTGRNAPIDAARPRPALGSPAQVWLERGERVRSEIQSKIAEQPGWSAVGADAESVVLDLADTAERVAALNQLLGSIDLTQLAAERDRLAVELATGPSTVPASGQVGPAVTAEQQQDTVRVDLRAAYQSISERLQLAQRRISARDTLLARMRAAVAGLEQCRDDVDDLIDGASARSQPVTAPAAELAERLSGLHAGLAEVAELPEVRRLSETSPLETGRLDPEPRLGAPEGPDPGAPPKTQADSPRDALPGHPE